MKLDVVKFNLQSNNQRGKKSILAGQCTAVFASKAKMWWRVPEGGTKSEEFFFQKTLILAFEAKSTTSLNCTFNRISAYYYALLGVVEQKNHLDLGDNGR